MRATGLTNKKYLCMRPKTTYRNSEIDSLQRKRGTKNIYCKIFVSIVIVQYRIISQFYSQGHAQIRATISAPTVSAVNYRLSSFGGGEGNQTFPSFQYFAKFHSSVSYRICFNFIPLYFNLKLCLPTLIFYVCTL